MQTSQKPFLSRYSVQLLLFAVIFGIAVIYIALASIPFNPLSLSYNQKSSIFVLVPQGWGFFTRNPRETEIYLYKKIGNDWIIYDEPNDAPSYFFGASRIGRRINFEKTYLEGKITDSTAWLANESIGINTKLFQSATIITITNDLQSPALLGEFAMVKADRIPWAWSSRFYSLKMPYKYVHFIAVPFKK